MAAPLTPENGTVPEEPQARRRGEEGPHPIRYTAEEVAQAFTAILQSLDFSREYKELDISRFRMGKRGLVLRQFTAVAIALWRLALKRSFPNDAEAFFAYFTENSPLFAGKGKKAGYMREQAAAYVTLLEPEGDKDFSVAAHHMLSALGFHETDWPRYTLKFSLRFRALYMHIFTYLI